MSKAPATPKTPAQIRAARNKLVKARREAAGLPTKSPNYLREYRLKAGLDIEEVAKRLRRSVIYMKQLECPSALLPPPMLARRLADLYGVGVTVLYFGERK